MDQIIWNFSIYGDVKYILHSPDTNPKPTVISRSKENNCIHFLISHEIMASVLKLVLILCMVCMFNCNKTNLILKNKSINDCPNYDDTVSSTNVKSLSLIDEFTFCGRFSFKFLKDSVLMSLEVSKTYIRLIDFERNYGLLQHDGAGNFFFFPNQTLNPDSWQHICLLSQKIH